MARRADAIAIRAARGAALEARAAAILDAGGRVLDARGGAVPFLAALRRAARAIDRARGPRRRTDPDGAIDAWTALVEGRWSLVDHFESDGKRFVLALPNPPGVADPRGLSAEELAIVDRVARGASNKLIAYELGYPEGTIARNVARIARKLGMRSRVGIIARHAALRGARGAALAIAGQPLALVECNAAPTLDAAPLTPAERAIALRAARGDSDAAIARARGTSVRTVSNLLLGVYRKLGVASRAELAARLAHSSAAT